MRTHAMRTARLAAVIGLWLVGPACIWPEPLNPADDDDVSGDDDSTPGDDDDFTADDDDDDDDTTASGDGDGDGWTPDEGDCDDGDPTVHPGAEDVCDDVDNDCDGVRNEDSPAYDEYELGSTDAYDLGDLTDTEYSLTSYLHTHGDIDRFDFYLEDETGIGESFFVEAWVDQVPAGVDVALDLIRVTDGNGDPDGTVLDSSNGWGAGGEESVLHWGSWGANDDGTYELAITALDGYDCNHAYGLRIATGT